MNDINYYDVTVKTEDWVDVVDYIYSTKRHSAFFHDGHQITETLGSMQRFRVCLPKEDMAFLKLKYDLKVRVLISDRITT